MLQLLESSDMQPYINNKTIIHNKRKRHHNKLQDIISKFNIPLDDNAHGRQILNMELKR